MKKFSGRKNKALEIQKIRRRIITLILTISLLTGTGILWIFSDIGITMADEIICGIDKHIHSEECFDEGGELICMLEGHVHSDDCFISEDLTEPVPDEVPEETEDESPADEAPDVSETEYPSAIDESAPGIVETIDNRDRGINFTLFDYHVYKNTDDRLDETPAGSNFYGNYNSDSSTGINYGKKLSDDILFFDYGTPPFRTDISNPDDSGLPRYQAGEPDKNNYSGDYQADSYQSGNRPIQGIVGNILGADSFPVIKSSGSSLAYLFNDEQVMDGSGRTSKWIYKNVNYLLQEENGHLVYDSNRNYAELQGVDNGESDSYSFRVYDRTFDIINSDHHKEGEIYRDNGNEIVAESTVNPGFKIGFFPFSEYNSAYRDPNWNAEGDYYNHHFGMKMDAEFQLPENADEPVTFSYSGDDDMWVFIDDVLVLDVGGIHEPASGMIDFTNGLVWVQDNALNPNHGGKTMETLEREWNPYIYNNADFYSVPKPTGCNENEEPMWIVRTIRSYFEEAGREWNPYSGVHSLDMFYLERGGCYSNLSMDMNLPTVGTLTVAKEVDFGSHLSDRYDESVYIFDVYEEGRQEPVAQDIRLKNGERRVIGGLDTDKRYYVVEKNIDTSYIESTEIDGIQSTGQTNVYSDTYTLAEKSTYKFINRIREEGGLTVRKIWNDASDNVDHSGHTIRYKIYKISDGESSELVIGKDGYITQTLGSSNTAVINGENVSWARYYPELPTRYGNISYSYKVVEDPVEGYKASASYENGVAVLVNTDESKVEINVKKEWKNSSDNHKLPVTVQLKRLRAKKNAAAEDAGTVTIRAVDDGGNVMYSYKVGTSASNSGSNVLISDALDKTVYVGGELEFRIDAEGCTTAENHISVNNGSVSCEHIAGSNYIIKNIQQGTVVTLYYDRIDGAALFHDSFTGGNLGGWTAFADAELLTSGSEAYALGDGLLVRNRTASHSGASKKLTAENGFASGKAYSFAVYVKKDSFNNDGRQSSFKLTLQYNLNGFTEYVQLDTAVNFGNAGEWSLLSGSGYIPLGAADVLLRVETAAYDGGNADLSSYRIDEAAAVEGIRDIDIGTDGRITLSRSNKTLSGEKIIDSDFGVGNTAGWEGKNGTNSGAAAIQGFRQDDNSVFLLAAGQINGIWSYTDRSDNDQGAMLKIPQLTPGKTYEFSFRFGNHNDTYSDKVIAGFYNGRGGYTWFEGSPQQLNGWDRGEITSVYRIPANADRNEMYVYLETTPDSQKRPFRVYDFSVREIIGSTFYTSAPEGYERVGTGYDSYIQKSAATAQIGIDGNSITRPIFSIGNLSYSEDTDFNNGNHTAVLDNDNSWRYMWSSSINSSEKNFISEHTDDGSSYAYLYYIVETRIGDNAELIYNTDDFNGYYPISGIYADDYFIEYPAENGISTNTSDSPLIIKNTYIRYLLPNTGGKGTAAVYMTGAFLTSVGVLGGIIYIKRKRRDKATL